MSPERPFHKAAVRDHFDQVSQTYDSYKKKNFYYYDEIKRFLIERIPSGSRVIDLGCGTGDLLEHVHPGYGLGIDSSEEMVKRARRKHPAYRFEVGDAEDLTINEKFQYVVMVDLLDHIGDIPKLFKSLNSVIEPGSILVVATANPLWTPFFSLVEKMNLKMPEGPHRFVSMNAIERILKCFNYEILSVGMRMLIPRKIPWLADFVNTRAPRIPLLKNLCLIQTLVARK